MKIMSFSLTNVTSYRDRTTFVFDPRINILIGPNGGGKSNAQRALAMVLSTYFLLQYDFKNDENQVSIEPVDLWNRRALAKELGRFFDHEPDQQIEIVLAPEASDVRNILAIGSNLERLNGKLSEWERRYESYAPFTHAEAIAKSESFVYSINNFEILEPEAGSAAWAFKEYLRTFFIFMRAAEGLVDVRLTSPVFCFFSQRTGAKSMDVQSTSFTPQNWYSGVRGVYTAALAENTNLLQWGAQHFARLHWRAIVAAAEDGTGKVTSDFFDREEDVRILRRYMNQLGYEWAFYTRKETATYTFALRPQGQEHWQTVDMFSAGEREIVHFLLAMFALSVRDGVVLVDEPELHLHPRWQRIFLGLFSELAPERNNQFIVATHSPVFVTPDTVNNVIRVYRDATKGSAHVALRDVQLPEKRALVRMINSQNNERVFFADKVVLVEGITDRLVIGALLEAVAARFHNNQAVEIVEVGGKGSFAGYVELLSALKTPTFVVADLDYLTLVGTPQVRALFDSSPEKQWEALLAKKSIDARSMIQCLEGAIATADIQELRKFRDYFVARHVRLRKQLSTADREAIGNDVARLRLENVMTLSQGEIENYLPPGKTTVQAIVDLLADRNWINGVPDPSPRMELGAIACQILAASQEESTLLQEELKAGSVVFPEAVSERKASN